MMRLQARDASGNVFTSVDFETAEDGIKAATKWIANYPEIPVELIAMPEPETHWPCHDCGALVYDMLRDECPLCGAGRLA